MKANKTKRPSKAQTGVSKSYTPKMNNKFSRFSKPTPLLRKIQNDKKSSQDISEEIKRNIECDLYLKDASWDADTEINDIPGKAIILVKNSGNQNKNDDFRTISNSRYDVYFKTEGGEDTNLRTTVKLSKNIINLEDTILYPRGMNGLIQHTADNKFKIDRGIEKLEKIARLKNRRISRNLFRFILGPLCAITTILTTTGVFPLEFGYLVLTLTCLNAVYAEIGDLFYSSGAFNKLMNCCCRSRCSKNKKEAKLSQKPTVSIDLSLNNESKNQHDQPAATTTTHANSENISAVQLTINDTDRDHNVTVEDNNANAAVEVKIKIEEETANRRESPRRGRGSHIHSNGNEPTRALPLSRLNHGRQINHEQQSAGIELSNIRLDDHTHGENNGRNGRSRSNSLSRQMPRAATPPATPRRLSLGTSNNGERNVRVSEVVPGRPSTPVNGRPATPKQKPNTPTSNLAPKHTQNNDLHVVLDARAERCLPAVAQGAGAGIGQQAAVLHAYQGAINGAISNGTSRRASNGTIKGAPTPTNRRRSLTKVQV